MARFFVGQRVRIAWCKYPENQWKVGRCGVITEPFEGARESGWVVSLDGVGIGYHLTGSPRWFVESQLEPITDRNTKVEWSECVWQPSGVKA
jgi:hypothetical protein